MGVWVCAARLGTRSLLDGYERMESAPGGLPGAAALFFGKLSIQELEKNPRVNTLDSTSRGDRANGNPLGLLLVAALIALSHQSS